MTTTLTPLLQNIEPVTLSTRLGRRAKFTCTIDGTGIQWGEHRLEFDDLTSLGYSTRTRRLNLVQRHLERRIRLLRGRDLFAIDLGHRSFGTDRDDEHLAIYSTVIASLHAQVEPRLRAEAIRAVAAGQSIQFGALRVSHDGLRVGHRSDRLEWRQLPVAQLEGDRVVVRATIEHDAEPLCVIAMLTPGAVLLPELLAEATVPFS